MSRFAVLIVLYCFFSLPSVGQIFGDNPAGSAKSGSDLSSPENTASRSHPTTEARVSIARLRVPRKARQLFAKTIATWKNHGLVEAQHKLDQALKIDPTFPEALALSGYMQASLRQWTTAEKSLQAAIRSDPGYSPAYIVLASVYNAEARYDEAEESIQRALSAGADTWKVQYEVARVLIGKGKYEDALAVTDAALRSKHLTLMHVAKAHALLGLRRYPEAVTELRAYLHYQPSGDGSQDANDMLDRLQSFAAR